MNDYNTIPPAWDGWYFEGEFLCSPNGDRFTTAAVQAVFFYRQMEQVRDLLMPWPTRVQ